MERLYASPSRPSQRSARAHDRTGISARADSTLRRPTSANGHLRPICADAHTRQRSPPATDERKASGSRGEKCGTGGMCAIVIAIATTNVTALWRAHSSPLVDARETQYLGSGATVRIRSYCYHRSSAARRASRGFGRERRVPLGKLMADVFPSSQASLNLSRSTASGVAIHVVRGLLATARPRASGAVRRFLNFKNAPAARETPSPAATARAPEDRRTSPRC